MRTPCPGRSEGGRPKQPCGLLPSRVVCCCAAELPGSTRDALDRRCGSRGRGTPRQGTPPEERGVPRSRPTRRDLDRGRLKCSVRLLSIPFVHETPCARKPRGGRAVTAGSQLIARATTTACVSRREPKAWNERGPRGTSAQDWAESRGALWGLSFAERTPTDPH
jgi:hypothetical protein